MADIKTRFTIEGEQQYKKAMSDAANAVKVLNSQQKLAKAQFQNTGDAQKYAAQQTEILRQKITQQRSAVTAAEQALKKLADQGVAANSRQMQQWQMRLNNAQTALEQMEGELREVGSTMQETGSAAQETGSAIESIGKKVSFDAVIGGLGRITGAMEAGARKARELATELVNTMRDAAAWSDDLATQATVYGIGTEELQRMRYTADLIDTSVESIMSSRKKLINNMVYGNEEVQNSFKELGIVTQEFYDGKYGQVAGGFRDWEDVFWEIGDALMNMEDVEQRNALAMKLMGKSFDDLLPMFDNDWAEKGFASAREYYESTMASWQVVSDENVAKLNALDDTVHKIENNFTTLKGTILGELAPAFTEVGDTVSGLLSEFNEYLQSDEGQAKLGELSEAVTGLFEGLTNVDFGAAMDKAKGALDSLTDGLGWIREHWPEVKTGLEGLAIAFGLMKVSQGVLTFMQLASSGKFLFGGGGKSAGGGSPATIPTTPAAPPSSGGNPIESLGPSMTWYGIRTAFEGWAQQAAATAAQALSGIGPFGLGAAGDWFFNNTDLGRFFRGEESWEDVLKSVQNNVDSVIENAKTFTEDWAGVFAEMRKAAENWLTDREKAILAEVQKEADLRRISEGIESWASRILVAAMNETDPSGWFGGNWGIVENENLDDGGPYFNLNDEQWTAAEKYWDTIREFGVMSDKATAGMMELMNAFDWTDQDIAEYEKLLDMMNSMGFKGTYNGEDLPEHWRGMAEEWFEDEPVPFPAEPELETNSQELLQAGLNMLTLKLPVTPILTGDSWLPFYPHANGLPYVPFDGYPAILHKGETVLPAREIESRSYNSNLYVENMNMSGGADAEGLAAAMAAAQRRTMAGFGS